MNCIKIGLVIMFLSLSMILQAQVLQAGESIVDSTKFTTIPMEEVPTNSLETAISLDELMAALISQDRIASENAKVDSNLKMIEKLLIAEEQVKLDSILSRSLVNKSNMWMIHKDYLEKQVNNYEDMFSELSNASKKVIYELKVWENTKLQIDSTYTDSLYSSSIDEVIFKADSINSDIVARMKICFSVLKRLRQDNIRVEKLLLKIKNIKRTRQEKIFDKNGPSFTKAKFAGHSHWNLNKRVQQFLSENIPIILTFLNTNFNTLILFIAYLILLIIFFYNVKSKISHISIQGKNVYESSAIKILGRPFSIALILAIFSSGLFFKNRPPILIDLNILLLTIPIIDIVLCVSKKKVNVYLTIFALLILLRFVNYIFPPDTPFHRLLLLLMGIMEVAILIKLFRNLNIADITNYTFNQLVRIIIVFHLCAAIVGIIANIMGYLTLAEIAIDLSITNTLVGFLLIISTVVLIGLLQLFIDGSYLKKFNFLQNRSQSVKKKIALIIIFLGALLWINYILQILRQRDVVYHFFDSILNTPISLGSASFTMGGVLLFFFIIWLSVIVSDIIKGILEDDVLNRVSLKKGVPRMISVVVRFSLISIGVFLAVSAIGMPLNQLTIIFSAFSVGIGFGLQNIVNNFVSGVILLFERPIQIGDAVEIGNLIGTVKSMGIRSSNISTFDGAEVIVPNANLISNEVINWTLSDKKRRIEIISGVAYGSDVYLVRKILLDMLNEHPDVMKKPEPLVLFNDLGESSLDFRILFWTNNYDNWIIIKSEIIFKIHDTLNEAGIKIPFPQRDLHINIKSKDIDEIK